MNLIAFIAAFYMASSASALNSSAKDELTVCIPKGRSEFLAFVTLAAQDHGYFTKQKLKIKITESPRVKANRWKVEGGKITQPEYLDYKVASFVSKGSECQVGASTIERFLADPSAPKNVRPLFVSNFGDQYDTHLLVPKGSKLKSVKDLRGKRLRLGQLPTYLAMIGLLESHGMSLKDVEVEYGLSGNEKLAALQAGRFDVTTAYLPGMAYLLATKQVSVLEPNIVSRFVSKRVPHSVMVVNNEFARQHPEMIARFQEALREGYEHLMRNPSEIFHTFVRHKNHEQDISMTSKADVEKATSFVGRVTFIDMTAKSSDREQSYCDMKNYGEILVQRGYLAKHTDLTAWTGVDTAKAKNCPPSDQNVLESSR